MTVGPAPESATPAAPASRRMSWTTCEVGDGRGAVRLVQTVRERSAEQLRAPGRDGGGEQPRVRDVERRVLVRDGVGQHRAGGPRRELAHRRHDHGRQPARRLEARAVGPARRRPAHREAAEERGRDVVGMALELGGELEHPHGAEVGSRERLAQQQPADDRRRGRAQAAAGGHAVGAADLGAQLGMARLGERARHRNGDQVVAVGRERARALARDVDAPLVGQLGLEAVVQLERQAEAVEARAEVGRGRRERGRRRPRTTASSTRMTDGDPVDDVERLDLGERRAHGRLARLVRHVDDLGDARLGTLLDDRGDRHARARRRRSRPRRARRAGRRRAGARSSAVSSSAMSRTGRCSVQVQPTSGAAVRAWMRRATSMRSPTTAEAAGSEPAPSPKNIVSPTESPTT